MRSCRSGWRLRAPAPIAAADFPARGALAACGIVSRKNPCDAMCRIYGAFTFCSLAFVASPPTRSVASGEEPLDRLRLEAGRRERREVRRTRRRGSAWRRSERRIGKDHRRVRSPDAASCMRNRSRPLRDIVRFVPLDQIRAPLVDQRLERHQIERTVGRDDEVHGVSERLREPAPSRLSTRRARRALTAGIVGIAQPRAQRVEHPIDGRGLAEVDADRRSLTADDVGGVVRRSEARRFVRPWIERTEHRELEQCGVFWDRRLHGFDRDRFRCRRGTRRCARSGSVSSCSLRASSAAIDSLLLARV